MEPVNAPSGLEVESASWKTRLSALPKQQFERVRPRVNAVKSTVNGQLRANPALFAGIAAGLGFALGLTGRIARHRIAKRHAPTLVVIEGEC
jgi:hypothetical protein